MRIVHLRGGPKDGETYTVPDYVTAFEFCQNKPAKLVGPNDPAPDPWDFREWHDIGVYRGSGADMHWAGWKP